MTGRTTSGAHDKARTIAEDLRDRMSSGEIGDREGLMEAMHESVDSCGTVIWTSEAKAAVCEHGTDAYTDSFGSEGLTKDGDINWPAIAFCIVERLAWEALEALGVNPNEPFACPTCGDTHDSADDARDCCGDED